MSDYAGIWEQSGEWCDESIYESTIVPREVVNVVGEVPMRLVADAVVPTLIAFDELSYGALCRPSGVGNFPTSLNRS